MADPLISRHYEFHYKRVDAPVVFSLVEGRDTATLLADEWQFRLNHAEDCIEDIVIVRDELRAWRVVTRTEQPPPDPVTEMD